MIRSIDIKSLMPIIDQVNIIDIRSIQNFNNNHLPNATNVPYNELIINPSKYLNIYKEYYIYCQKGVTSIKVCNILKNGGYKVINIIGGYESWILEK